MDINHECKPAKMFFRWFHKILERKLFSPFLLVSLEWARWALSPCSREQQLKEELRKGFGVRRKKSLRQREVLTHVMVKFP
jgi:hypothetical protein